MLNVRPAGHVIFSVCINCLPFSIAASFIIMQFVCFTDSYCDACQDAERCKRPGPSHGVPFLSQILFCTSCSHQDLHISLKEALVGFSHQILHLGPFIVSCDNANIHFTRSPFLDGHEVIISRNGITQPYYLHKVLYFYYI